MQPRVNTLLTWPALADTQMLDADAITELAPETAFGVLQGPFNSAGDQSALQQDHPSFIGEAHPYGVSERAIRFGARLRPAAPQQAFSTPGVKCIWVVSADSDCSTERPERVHRRLSLGASAYVENWVTESADVRAPLLEVIVEASFASSERIETCLGSLDGQHALTDRCSPLEAVRGVVTREVVYLG
jgi:hypothetical protein